MKIRTRTTFILLCLNLNRVELQRTLESERQDNFIIRISARQKFFSLSFPLGFFEKNYWRESFFCSREILKAIIKCTAQYFQKFHMLLLCSNAWIMNAISKLTKALSYFPMELDRPPIS